MNAYGFPYNGEYNDDYVNGQFCPRDIVGCTREFANEFAFLSLARQFCCNDGTPEAAQAKAMTRAAIDGNLTMLNLGGTRQTASSLALPSLAQGFKPNDEYEKMQFYYHPDHLGSSSYITNLDGEVSQHIEYVPFGAVFIEERNNTWNTPYLFNAKELDEETGLYYYGARYYDPRLSLWMSTDPLEEKNFLISSYGFTQNNPINVIDYDGKDGVRIIDDESKTITIKADYYVVTGPTQYREKNKIKELKGYSDKELNKMKGYNDYLNNLKLEVPSGEYEGYSIRFDLSFIGVESGWEATIMSAEAMYDNHPIGNTIQLGSEKTHKHLNFHTKYNEDGSTSTVGGVTDSNKAIVMNQKEDSKINRIHEIFHTFGFSHPKGLGGSQGIMKYPPSNPSKADALELSTTKFLPSIKK